MSALPMQTETATPQNPATTANAVAPLSVELRGVAKRFGAVTAVEDASLSIRRGEFLTLLGPSGCGKTTTLRLIAGFESPSDGEILIEGRAMHALPAYKRPVNTVFQNYALFPHMSVGDNVAFGLRMARVPAPERRRRAAKALAQVRLGGLESRRPGQLSGGQQQRVALARALVNRPSVLLLDEPLGALDLKLRRAMQSELRALNREVGITFVYVTHDQEEALAMSDRIAVMAGGRVLQVGPAEDIYEWPASRFVADFVGEANLLPGRFARIVDGAAEIELAGDAVVRGRAPRETGVAPGQQVTLAVRPERIRVAGMDEAEADTHASGLRGTLVETLYLGAALQHAVALADGTRVTARVPYDGAATAAPRPGETVVLGWLPDNATMLTR